MISVSSQRPRMSSRIFGALLSFLLFAGQTALIAHHHPARARNNSRVSLSQQDNLNADANCQLCSLSTQSSAAHVGSAPLVASALVVEPALVVPSAIFSRTATILPSSRAPPSA